MFYRIGKIKCKPGKSDDVISYFKSKEDFFSETKGIISLSYFKLSDIFTGSSKRSEEGNWYLRFGFFLSAT